MYQKIPYLTRQIVYAFLIGLIVGGVAIGLFDAYANEPLFSSAFDGDCFQETQTAVTVDGDTEFDLPVAYSLVCDDSINAGGSMGLPNHPQLQN